jgi:hypothetical protein
MTTTTTANGSSIALIPKPQQRMLEKANTIDEIRAVENLAQLACEYAKKARLGRDAINSATRHALDARRKAGDTLKAMMERGELAAPGKPKMSQRATFTLKDLGLTRSKSSFYQQEASVPPDVYEAWVRRVIESKDGILSAAGLRALARQLGKSDECDDSPVLFAAAASRIRRLVAKLWKGMGDDGRACLPEFLKSLSSEYERDCP